MNPYLSVHARCADLMLLGQPSSPHRLSDGSICLKLCIVRQLADPRPAEERRARGVRQGHQGDRHGDAGRDITMLALFPCRFS